MFDVKPITSPKPVDCGATCLQMLLLYYGIDSDLTTLTKECNTRIIGCTAKDIKEAGSKYGLDIHVYEMEASELIEQDRPAIVWWKKNHFCIFSGVDENGNIMICNPDRGRYRMSYQTFKSFYCDVAIFNGVPNYLEEPQTFAGKIDKLKAENSALMEYLGVTVRPIGDGVYEVVKEDPGTGDYTNPIKYEQGMSITKYLWYYLDDKDIPHEAIKEGVPFSFYDRNYFDFVE